MLDIKQIIKDHAEWLLDSTKGKRANLSGADLSGADLFGANLSRADLSGADLSRANLSRANLSGAGLSRADLSGADLFGANLSRANLSGANLSRANLSGADLSGADLFGANLSRANLSGANLSGANLSGADLFGANLSRANLSRADLSRADLSRADLSGANLSGANLSIEEWENIKYKFALVTSDTKYVYKSLSNNTVAFLEIPKKAKRSNAFSRKCRAEYVKVLKIVDKDGKEIKESYSHYDNELKYKKGKIVRPKHEWNDKWYEECGSGIHFFLTEQEAREFIW